MKYLWGLILFSSFYTQVFSQSFTLESSEKWRYVHDAELHGGNYYFREGLNNYALRQLNLDTKQGSRQIADTLGLFYYGFTSTSQGVFGVLQTPERKLVQLEDKGIKYLKNFGKDIEVLFFGCDDTAKAFVVSSEYKLGANEVKVYSFDYISHSLDLLTEFEATEIRRSVVYKNNLIYTRTEKAGFGTFMWDMKKGKETSLAEALGLDDSYFFPIHFSVVNNKFYFSEGLFNKGFLLYETDLKRTRLVNKDTTDRMFLQRVIYSTEGQVFYWAWPYKSKNTYVLLDSLGAADTVFKEQWLYGKLFKDNEMYYSKRSANDGLWRYNFTTKKHEHIYKDLPVSRENEDIKQLIEYRDGVVFLQERERTVGRLLVGYYKDEQLTTMYAPDSGIRLGNQDTTVSQNMATNVFEYQDDLYLYYTSDTLSLLYRLDIRVGGISFTKLTDAADVSVYPNPCTHAVHITSTSQSIEGVEVYNSNGQRIYTDAVVPNGTLNTEEWAQGMYHLRIRTKEGIQLKTVVKQ